MSIPNKLRKLASSSGIIMVSRLGGAGIGFLTQFLLVKLMGAHQLGLFYAASSLAAVLGVIAAQGYPAIAARFIGRYRNKHADVLCGTFTGHALREGLIMAALMAVAVTFWAVFWPDLMSEERGVYVIAGWMVVAIVTLNILTNIAGGMRHFALCYMPEGLLRPIMFFVSIAAAGLVGLVLTAEVTMLVFAAITSSLAVAVAVLLSRHAPPVKFAMASQPALSWRWRNEAWQLIVLSIFTNFFADVGILVAVPFLSHSEIAVFGLCLKLALLVGYFVQIGQQMVVPDMADARHKGDQDRLHRAAWRSIIVPSVLTAVSIGVIYVYGEQLLALFGADFAMGRTTLLILLAAQLLRALAGPSAHLLTLSGIQSVNMGLATSSLLILFLASAVLSPVYGVEGAGYAVLLAYVYWIGASAVALRWLREPSVDVMWLTFRSLRT